MPQPKLLLIGDSISIGYHAHVAQLLDGRYAVVHHEGNSGDSAALRQNLDAYLAADADAAVIHFNVGLHDLRRCPPDDRYQQTIDRYGENLAAIVERLQQTSATLIWASTTPVITARHDRPGAAFRRFNQDILDYNAVASEIVAAAGIPIDDLHAVTAAADPEKVLRLDGVHFTDEGYLLLARSVVDAVDRYVSA